jgi:hypothetical protein
MHHHTWLTVLLFAKINYFAFSMNGIIDHGLFLAYVLSDDIMVLRFTHFVQISSSSFLLYCIVWMYYSLFIQWILGHFPILESIQKAAINIYVGVFVRACTSYLG